MPPGIPEPTIPSDVNTARVGDVEKWCRTVAGFFDRSPAEVTVTATAEAADVRRFTVQVADRRLRPVAGRWNVHLWLTDDASGLPGGTQTVTFVTGDVQDTYIPQVRWTVRTDDYGKIVMDVEVTGAGSRRVVAIASPAPQESGSFAWQ